MKINNNSFGSLLEQILVTAGIKNYTLAGELNYDVSYISKWLSGKSVPSGKNIENIARRIADMTISTGSRDGREKLKYRFGAADERELEEKIYSELISAYSSTTGKINRDRYASNASVMVHPDSQYALLQDYIREIDVSKPLNIAVLADFFSLDKTSKLLLAGIEKDGFRLRKMRDDIHIHFITDITQLKGESIYDVILFIHMLTNYSLTDFSLLHSHFASGKLVFSVMDQYAGMNILTDNRQFLCMSSTKSKNEVNGIFQEIMALENPDRTMFSATGIDRMLESHEYIQTLVSPNIRWLVGHMTEHFLSPEIFDQFVGEVFGGMESLAEEARKAYLLSQNVLYKKEISMMVYDTALTDFILSGEVDFFNHRVVLNPLQRKVQMEYLRDSFRSKKNLQIKMVEEGFSADFRYITNPCIFLSDSIDYLRLENGFYEKNILLLSDKTLRNIFNRFFEEIWNNSREVVISDLSVILEKVENLIDAARLLANVD